MEKKRLALRKLLEAVEKEILRKPDKKTLDRLSLLAGFQSWDDFAASFFLFYSPTLWRFSLMRAALPVSLRR